MAAIHSDFSALVWRKTTKRSHNQSPKIQTQGEIVSVWRESAMSVGGEIPERYRKFFLWAIFARFLFISLVSQMLSSVGKMLSHWELHSRPQEWLETTERQIIDRMYIADPQEPVQFLGTCTGEMVGRLFYECITLLDHFLRASVYLQHALDVYVRKIEQNCR